MTTTRKMKKAARRVKYGRSVPSAKFTGVFFIPCKQKWDAVVRVKRCAHHLSADLFETEAAAADAIFAYLHPVAPEPEPAVEDTSGWADRMVPTGKWTKKFFPDRVIKSLKRTWDNEGTPRTFYLYAAKAAEAVAEGI